MPLFNLYVRTNYFIIRQATYHKLVVPLGLDRHIQATDSLNCNNPI